MKKTYIQPQVTMCEIEGDISLMVTSAEISGETDIQYSKEDNLFSDNNNFGW